jgi:tRNA-specific 2-thiouridylase
MLSEAVIRHALGAQRAGSCDTRGWVGEAGSDACGDRLRIELAAADGRVAQARYRAHACIHATAAAALACELAEGRDLLDAARIGQSDLEGELEPEPGHRECLALAVDALHVALAGALASASLQPADHRAVVAMSGGVDSAVALLKAVEQGLDPVGVTLRLWIDPSAPDAGRACCSADSVRAARSACHAMGVPHVSLDLREAFRLAVVDPFVAGYATGSTPNPCIRCNGGFRLAELVGFADRIGAGPVLTGHYARLVERDGHTLVATAHDPVKDQSYMLSQVPEAVLRRLRFPLGGQDKTTTREQARAARLEAAGRRESQEICFVGGGDHRTFLEANGGSGRRGEIVDEQGGVLGEHEGLHRFTPGQRRGIGVASEQPVFVLRNEPATGRVVVGPRERLATTTVRVEPAELRVDVDRVQAKLRYRSPAVWASVREEGGALILELDEPAYGIAPGQAAVLYDGDAVVGAGVITR